MHKLHKPLQRRRFISCSSFVWELNVEGYQHLKYNILEKALIKIRLNIVRFWNSQRKHSKAMTFKRKPILQATVRGLICGILHMLLYFRTSKSAPNSISCTPRCAWTGSWHTLYLSVALRLLPSHLAAPKRSRNTFWTTSPADLVGTTSTPLYSATSRSFYNAPYVASLRNHSATTMWFNWPGIIFWDEIKVHEGTDVNGQEIRRANVRIEV